jgi:hypothetical protein
MKQREYLTLELAPEVKNIPLRVACFFGIAKYNTFPMKTVIGVCLMMFLHCFVQAQDDMMFEPLGSAATGVTFRNTLEESPTANVLTYEYFFNGGGVAIGDINNDGLDDIYFTGNMKPNALYLNEGNFRFKDISRTAGVSCNADWKTGVTMADVNGDWKPDIHRKSRGIRIG